MRIHPDSEIKVSTPMNIALKCMLIGLIYLIMRPLKPRVVTPTYNIFEVLSNPYAFTLFIIAIIFLTFIAVIIVFEFKKEPTKELKAKINRAILKSHGLKEDDWFCAKTRIDVEESVEEILELLN